MSKVILKTGDILLTQWVSIFGTFAEISGQRWGHVAICVVLEGDNKQPETCVYEISLETGKPTVMPLSTMLKQPGLKEVGIRQLSKPLTPQQEEQFKDVLLEYNDTKYPAVKKVIARLLSASKQARNEETDEYLCSELVYNILYSMKWVPESKSVFGTLPVLPDAFTAGTLPILDGLYGPTVKIVYKRTIPAEEQKALLLPQMQFLVHHLV